MANEIPLWVRGLSSIAHAAPGVGAVLGESLMFRTRRRPGSAGERAVLERAERISVPTAHGDLAVWRWGAGPTVLMVHGWNGRAGQLAAFVEPLVALGYEVVAFDAPGHGESPGTRSSLVHFAEAVHEVIEELRPMLGPIHAIVAHSMGGPAVVYAMRRWRERQGPNGIERALADSELPVRRFVLIAPPIDVNEFLSSFVRMTALGARAEALMKARVEKKLGVAFDDLYAPPIARTLRAPALVLHDQEDREVPIDRGRRLAAAWPAATLVETRGLGHVRILADPGVVARVVEFVAA